MRVEKQRCFAVLWGSLVVLSFSSYGYSFCRLTTVCNEKDCNDVEKNGCPKGTPVKWPTSCVSFSLQRNFSKKYPVEETRALLHRAIDAWSNVTCPVEQFKCKSEAACKPSIKFSEVPTPEADGVSKGVSCRQSAFNVSLPNVNVIFFQDNGWIYKGTGNVLARTTTKWNPTTGDITDSDMEINSSQIAYTLDLKKQPPESTAGTFELYDLQAIVTHELGHFLGLAHSEDRSATMWQSYAPGQNSLTDDDIKAICTVYPPGSPDYCNPIPINGFSGDCSDTPGGDNQPPSSFCAASTPRLTPSWWKAGAGLALVLAVGGTIRRRARRHAAA